MRALEKMKRGNTHLFQGTVARYILSYEETARHVQFFFVWRQTVMPEPQDLIRQLDALRTTLDSVLAWDEATYRTTRIWMHA